nr:MAG TPA: hypothetical protein [Bacteriophage sp.]
MLLVYLYKFDFKISFNCYNFACKQFDFSCVHSFYIDFVILHGKNPFLMSGDPVCYLFLSMYL